MVRRRRIGLSLALVALVGAAALLGAWLYGPVEEAVGLAGPADEREGRKMTWQESIGIRGVDVMVLDADRFDSFAFALDVRNTGRLALTFGRFEPEDEVYAVRISDIRISRRASETTGGGPAEWVPLDGVTIEPGQTRMLRVTVSHDFCDGTEDFEGATSSFATVELSYGIGPLRWNHDLELPFDVTLLCGELDSGNV